MIRSPRSKQLVNSLFLFVLCTQILWISAVRADTFTAEVDRKQLSVDETLTLTLSWDAQTLDSPDFSPLEKDFEVLSRQRRSQLAMGFGRNQSSTEWILTLAPRSTGKLTIPPIPFKGAASKAVTIDVVEQSQTPDAEREIFLETELDRQSAYVQGEILLTLRLYTSVNLGSVEFPELSIPSARTLKINDTQYRKTIDGREHIVVELKYAIFPETSGTLTIPRLTVVGVVPSSSDPFGGSSLFGARGKPVRLLSDEKTVEVLPVPAQAGEESWLPAKGVSLNQRWSRKPEDLRVGEPITRTVSVAAQGITGAQIPPLALEPGDDFKIYPDQPEITEDLSESGVVGIRRESVALVPTRPGTLTLPPVTLRWWDVESREMKTATLEPQTLEILPAAEASQPTDATGTPATGEETTAGSSSATEFPWFYLSVTANVLLVIGLLGMFVLRRNAAPGAGASPAPPDAETEESRVFRRLMATDENQPRLLRENLIHWGRLFWPEYRIRTLEDVGNRCGDGVKAIRKSWRADGVKPPALKPLYPGD